jgi:hypothetical protein
MTSEKAYGGRPRTREEALGELARCAGHEFEPGIVAACLEELGGGL